MSMITYTVDRNDFIRSTNAEWDIFASKNDGEKIMSANIAGKSLWAFITNEVVRNLYQILFDKVRSTGASIELPYRCDSPEFRRFMKLKIISGKEGAIRFESRTIRLERREPVEFLNKGADETVTTDMVTMCSWCKCIETPCGDWLETEEGIERLGLLAEPIRAQITHGICEKCMMIWREKIKTLNRIAM